MRPSAAVSDMGRSYRWFCYKKYWRPKGPLIREFEVSMDASFQAGSNDTISRHIRHRRPDISPPFHGGAITARTYVITWDCSHWPLHVGGRGVIETCHLLTAAALSSRSYVIRIVFSLPMSSSLVCWISPTAVRKKVARVPLGRGLTFSQWFKIKYTDRTPVIICCVPSGLRLMWIFVDDFRKKTHLADFSLGVFLFSVGPLLQ